MPEFQPEYLAKITGGKWHAGQPAVVEAFCFDTRKIKRGNCFVALKSDNRDGHDFLEDALVKGASSAITGRAVDCNLPQLVVGDPLSAMGEIAAELRSKFPKPVAAITGSCGKTSTKEMLRLLLGESLTHATPGNWNNRIGVAMTLFGLDPRKQEFAVIEAGINQPGEMALLGGMIRADLSILTNIGPAHLELLGSLEGIAREKSRLAEMSQAEAPIVLPAEVLRYPAFAAMAERCHAVQFDAGKGSNEYFHFCRGLATARSTDEPPRSELTEKPVGGHANAGMIAVKELVSCRIEPSSGGNATRLLIDGHGYTVQSSSMGIARNAALAIVAARSLGVPEQVLVERIRQWEPGCTRGKVVDTGDRFEYIDCYNANPASMIDSLQAFQNAAPANLARCYIIGAMDELGESAGDCHIAVGKRLRLRQEDRVVFVGPRDMTAAYMQGIKANGAASGQLQCLENIQGIESMVADFKGALFLKGSRAYHLEKLLPEYFC